jgi:uncharacterized membrane protein
MTFCGNCGTQVQDGVKFCPVCGAEVLVVATAAAAQQGQPAQTQYQQFGGQAQQNPASDAQANKGMAVLAYILFFVPLIAGAHKTSPYVKFHANQGTVLFLVALIWGIIYAIITSIITAALFSGYGWLYGTGWGVWGIVTTVLGLLWLIPTILCVLGIVNAATGKTKPLPVIGKFKIIK